MRTRETAAWSNQAVFKFLLHEVDLEASVRTVDERLGEALAPLRTKLDMVIEMLGRLSYRDVALPPACAIQLSPHRIGWSLESAVAEGDWVRFHLYFHPTFLEPIVLYGRVVSCIGGDPDGFYAQAELDELPEPTGEAFARLAFMAQRRQLGRRPAAPVMRSDA